jgi:hypothetical protein
MTDTVTVVRDMEGWILDLVGKSNAVALEALKVATDAIQPMASAIPSVTPPLAYDFTEQLMASERAFAENVLHLTARLTPAHATAK